MGQANSTSAAQQQQQPPQRPPRRPRPASWAPSLLSRPLQPDRDAAPALHLPPSTARTTVSQRLNPFARISSHARPHDAGPSALSIGRPPRPRYGLSRARSSLSSLSGFTDTLFNRQPSTARISDPFARGAGRATARSPADSAAESGPVLPPMHIPDLDIDLDRLMRSVSHGERTQSHRTRSRDLGPLRRDGRTLSMLPAQRRLRNIMGSARRRRSLWHDDDHLDNMERLRRGEDQADVLSRLLSLAAEATAASLVGDDNPTATRDGTFDTFLQSLQNGSIASALRGNEGGDAGENAGGSTQPLNFFRMFRFGSSVESRRSDRAGSRGSGATNDNHDEDGEGEGRMVPIIIVGIRSISPGSNPGQDDGNIPPFIDALSSFPTPPTSPGDNDHVLQSPQNGTRFSHRRRASMGGFNFPSNYESQRHHRAHHNERSRPWSSLADSPPGPLPPPSTPATSLGLSAEPSGTTTPVSSTSPPSPIIQSMAPSRRNSFARRTTSAALEPTAEEPPSSHRNARQRRLSESDSPRYGSGAPRRRGVVEPDNNPGEGSRSWIIYVLGGSYPENHPILTTPSLFTDSPTYEDMMLLSSILGPAKPPVASEEDVASARGVFVIKAVTAGLGAGGLVATSLDGGESLSLSGDARCLVCLCEFEPEEEARKLINCEHMFHRICIDQWLTTGRNSCPLCRGQGVDESNKPESGASNEPGLATTTASASAA